MTQRKGKFPEYGKQVLFCYESDVIRVTLKPKQLERFFEKNVFFSSGGGLRRRIHLDSKILINPIY